MTGYRGPAALTADDRELTVDVHLTGHLEPLDGRYHWYGRIAGQPEVAALLDAGRRAVAVCLPGGQPAAGRLTERDPWGNVRVTGVGPPPFARESVP